MTTTDPLDEVVGRELSAVTFVRDYVQLQFDPPPTINLLTPITVRADGRVFRSGDAGFRDALCALISKRVVAIRAVEGDALTISFSDGSAVAASLSTRDCPGGEAAVLMGANGRWAVW